MTNDHAEHVDEQPTKSTDEPIVDDAHREQIQHGAPAEMPSVQTSPSEPTTSPHEGAPSLPAEATPSAVETETATSVEQPTVTPAQEIVTPATETATAEQLSQEQVTEEPAITEQAEVPSEQAPPPVSEEPAPVGVDTAVMPQRFYATGRRKESVARVWLIPGGSGQITVNDKPIEQYLYRYSLVHHVVEPFLVTQTWGMFDVKATARGGGLTGQAGALRHGIARALLAWNPELRPTLRKAGLLTRDPRAKERKKYGRKRARRGFQFRKR